MMPPVVLKVILEGKRNDDHDDFDDDDDRGMAPYNRAYVTHLVSLYLMHAYSHSSWYRNNICSSSERRV